MQILHYNLWNIPSPMRLSPKYCNNVMKYNYLNGNTFHAYNFMLQMHDFLIRPTDCKYWTTPHPTTTTTHHIHPTACKYSTTTHPTTSSHWLQVLNTTTPDDNNNTPRLASSFILTIAAAQTVLVAAMLLQVHK